MEDEYKRRYEALVDAITRLRDECRQEAIDNMEPAWPDEILDRKDVIKFRNDLVDHIYPSGMRCALNYLLKCVIPKIESKKEEGS